MRIVSLLPSSTEIICQLGLGDALVGVTHECDYPPFVADLPKVTRTLIPHDASSREIDELVRERLKTQRALYTLDLPTLERLRPDLIVTQALCDVCAVAEAEVTAAACALPGRPRVVNLEPTSLDEVLTTLRMVADTAGVSDRADAVIGALQQRIDSVAARSMRVTERPRVVVLEWLDPPFSCGHWTPELVQLAGGDEVLGRAGQPSRTLTWDEVIAAQPDVLFVACCGFSLERTLVDLPGLCSRPGWANLPAVKTEQVYVTDGNAYFSRPGPRLVDSLEIIAHTLHPDLHPLPPGLPPAQHWVLNRASCRSSVAGLCEAGEPHTVDVPASVRPATENNQNKII
ncbi:corrinoid ABC transporter substrate-binding protein [Gemmata sp. SH-PL17]|uniref:cobalamin-binding protein n=1 Tax=Gemmata sp. SH-PL17 TaxID=1630693 RepID=UPI00078B4E61|nr:cobalamin-binding protein [Gemmata sp. SH-PL17]AMV28100.1 corrinoid ABC transporter substrate-binding protein [Gemmata sp. SH-PL17]